MRIKLNVVSSTVRGKRVVLVDDSIVRGHDLGPHQPAADAGAKEVHFVVSAPLRSRSTPATLRTDIPTRRCWWLPGAMSRTDQRDHRR